MTREQLEHVLRVSAALTSQDEFVVIGSQALLASHPGAPDELLRSMEVDLYPPHAPELADLLDGTIGELPPSTRPAATTRTQWGPKRPASLRRGATGWCGSKPPAA